MCDGRAGVSLVCRASIPSPAACLFHVFTRCHHDVWCQWCCAGCYDLPEDDDDLEDGPGDGSDGEEGLALTSSTELAERGEGVQGGPANPLPVGGGDPGTVPGAAHAV